jgi:CheY-like chemotaxis protein
MAAGDVSILVVDDDRAIRSLLEALLLRSGATVDSASDGREAIERLRTGAYAAIILDLMMPVVDGFEVLEHVRSNAPELLSRIIVLTAVSQKRLDALAQYSGDIWAVIRKPFDLNELMASVTACATAARTAN